MTNSTNGATDQRRTAKNRSVPKAGQVAAAPIQANGYRLPSRSSTALRRTPPEWNGCARRSIPLTYQTETVSIDFALLDNCSVSSYNICYRI
jgi:hypothetical protein